MTVPLEDRVLAVFSFVWHRLPSVKHDIDIESIVLKDLGSKHGSWDPSTYILTLSTRLFEGNAEGIALFDVDGNSPPMKLPFTSRATHTVTHELFHAIGSATGLDFSPGWLDLSGWLEDDMNPMNTARYRELRPGWPQIISAWRHNTGTWFVRDYSRRSPAEDFADAATHVALGWDDFFSAPHPYRENALAKLAFLRRHLWNEKGSAAIAAARQRWQEKFAGVYV